MKFLRGVDGDLVILHARSMRWCVIIACLLVGCAGGGSLSSLGPVGLYRVGGDGVSLERVRTIELPNRADIIVRPQWFSGALNTPEDAVDDVRIQVQVRLTRADGVEQRFFMTGDNSDKTGTRRGFRSQRTPVDIPTPLRVAATVQSTHSSRLLWSF